ncbi:MAG: hypothetical protein IJG87_03380 [Ruminococcus sp.]|nr:hypothetical protein [Ruminococcus sp.]
MDKMRFEREAYERSLLLITQFDKEDVIATSTPSLDISDGDNLTTVGKRVIQNI